MGRENIKTYYAQINSLFSIMNISFAIFCFIVCTQSLFSQQTGGGNDIRSAKNFYEELFVLTDRDTYISGEEVWFKVYKLNGLNHAPCDISKVVYLELLDKNNFPVKQIKLKSNGNSGSSVFSLPDNISSGNFIIRAYTNWMKNYPVDLFFYKEITVINPFEKITNINLPSGSQSRKTGITEVKRVSTAEENPDQISITLSLEKPEYSKREKVRIGISATSKAGNPVVMDLTVSVVKNGILNSDKGDQFNSSSVSPYIPGTLNLNIDKPIYIPELEEHIISGFIRSKGTDEPLKKTDLSLSFVGKSDGISLAGQITTGSFTSW